MTAQAPLPELTETNRFFWCSGADGQLRIQRCDACGFWLHPPGVICPSCLGRALSPHVVNGVGTVEAVTVNHQPWFPGQEVPFVIAIVSLAQAPSIRLTARLVDTPDDGVSIGQRVHVRFESREDVHIPMFAPA